MLNRGREVEFNCSSVDAFTSCGWTPPRPTSLQSCGVFGEKTENCNWNSLGNYNIRTETRRGKHVCSLHGTVGLDDEHPEDGEWRCKLDGRDSDDSDSQYFTVELLRPADVELSLDSLEMEVGQQDVEFTCSASGGNTR